MTHTKLTQHLVALGLTDEEGAVYLALLEMGLGNVSDIATRLTMHRSKTKASLERLKELGMVSMHQKGKRILYTPEHPEGLRNSIARQQAHLEEVLPQLVECFQKQSIQPVVRFFSGKAGITEVYHDLLRSLKKGEVFFRYESPEDFKTQDAYLPRAYFERICDKKEIDKFVITNDVTARTKPTRLERSIKVVPLTFDPFIYNVTHIIYANKVAFLDFDTQTAWIIENQRFATFQRQLFKLLYHKL